MRLNLPCAAALCAFTASAASFTITNLGSPEFDTEASAINSAGAAAITSFLPPANAIASGINAQGWIAGATFSQNGAQAMIFYDGQSWAVANFDTDSYAKDVNSQGQIVGSAGGRAYIAQNGQAVFLSHPLDSIADTANAINENGAVAGTMVDTSGTARAYIWYNGQTLWTGFLGGHHSFASNLNDSGQAVGYAQTAEGWMHAFLSANGETLDLGTLGGSCSYAYGINSDGSVVGYSYRADGSMGAFLFVDGVMLDLSSLVEGLDGWFLNAAYGINDSGQIVGTGFYNGRRTAFRLDPVQQVEALGAPADLLESAAIPEPSTGALLLFGVLGVFITRQLGHTGKSQ
jgi:probable HAF family extracellular repeat protein